MNDKEKYNVDQFVHVYLALMRKKDNDVEGKPAHKRVFRHVCLDETLDYNILKNKCNSLPGIWRIYKTVNKRDRFKARDLMMIELIKNPHKYPESLFRTCLLQPECKAENKFMIDIDTKDLVIFEEITKILNKNKVINKNSRVISTPNGYHIICEKFDTRILYNYNQKYVSLNITGYDEVEQREPFKVLEIKKDAYYFVEQFEVK